MSGEPQGHWAHGQTWQPKYQAIPIFGPDLKAGKAYLQARRELGLDEPAYLPMASLRAGVPVYTNEGMTDGSVLDVRLGFVLGLLGGVALAAAIALVTMRGRRN